MTEFFQAMGGFELALWYTAIFCSVVFVVQSLMILLGGDTDTETEMETDFNSTDVDHAQDDTGKSFGWFSFKNLINFFLIFAWVGISCLNSSLSTALTLFISTIAGLGFVVLMIFVFKVIKSLSQDNTPKLSSLVGTDGVVYLFIPDNGKGKINIVFGGGIKTLDAMSESGDIKTGSLVKVTKITGDSIIVVKQI